MSLQTIILFSSCVNPNGMSNTVLQDKSIRLMQYKQALNYLLSKTLLKIVVVDNSDYDYSHCFVEYIKANRLEFIVFKGNGYDKNLGKGFGEAMIINKALKESLFIKNTDYIIKFTGRSKIENISKLISKALRISSNTQDIIGCDSLLSFTYVSTKFIIAPKSFYADYLIPNMDSINDSKGIWFERVFLDGISAWIKNGNRLHIFSIPFIYDGVSGTTGKVLPRPTLRSNIKALLKSNLLNNTYIIKMLNKRYIRFTDMPQ